MADETDTQPGPPEYDLRHGVYRRIYRDGVLHGRRINSVSLGAEWFLLCRLQSVMDDYGIFEADPVELWHNAIARRRDEVQVKRVKLWLEELKTAGLTHYYYVNATNSDANDPLRHKSGTFGLMLNAPPLPATRNGRRVAKYPHPLDLQFAAGVWVNPGESGGFLTYPGDNRPLQTTTDQTKPNEVKVKKEGRTPNAPVWAPDTGWTNLDTHLERWGEAYPAVDIALALRQMSEWLIANPEKATKSRWGRFITNWLQREQNRGGGSAVRADLSDGTRRRKSTQLPHQEPETDNSNMVANLRERGMVR